MDRPTNNPQATEFASDAMVDNLAAQAEAIWPQEKALFRRYRAKRILDVGCGTGEITRKLSGLWPGAKIVGVDLDEAHLERARALTTSPQITYEAGDAYELRFQSARFDLTVCRHLLQSLTRPLDVLQELVRLTAPGGHVHVLAEDYGMIHFHPTKLDNAAFWRDGPVAFARAIDTELNVGRRTVGWLEEVGLADITCDYVVVDTVRCREAMQQIWSAWRRAYTQAIVDHTALSTVEVEAHWDDMDAVLADPRGYAVWHVPVVAGRVPRT